MIEVDSCWSIPEPVSALLAALGLWLALLPLLPHVDLGAGFLRSRAPSVQVAVAHSTAALAQLASLCYHCFSPGTERLILRRVELTVPLVLLTSAVAALQVSHTWKMRGALAACSWAGCVCVVFTFGTAQETLGCAVGWVVTLLPCAWAWHRTGAALGWGAAAFLALAMVLVSRGPSLRPSGLGAHEMSHILALVGWVAHGRKLHLGI